MTKSSSPVQWSSLSQVMPAARLSTTKARAQRQSTIVPTNGSVLRSRTGASWLVGTRRESTGTDWLVR